MSGMSMTGHECVICMESIEGGVSLPCDCAVHYCLGCWDRSLAVSFKKSGQARCPTCRGAVQVDFDARGRDGLGALVFTRDANALPDAPVATGADDEDLDDYDRAVADRVEEVVNRLAGQAAPLMTRLLRTYGRDHASLRAVAFDPVGSLGRRPVRELKAQLAALGGSPAGCSEKRDLVDRLVETAGGPERLAAFVASVDDGDDGGLACVCGGRLKRMDGASRYRRFCEAEFPDATPQELERIGRTIHAADAAAGISNIICDVCDEQVPCQNCAFTCLAQGRAPRGRETLLEREGGAPGRSVA